MTYPAATGPITEGVFGLARLLRESAAFRALVGADDEATAEGSIWLWDLRTEDPLVLQRLRPFAAIWPADQLDLSQYAGGSQIWLAGGGAVVLLLTDVDRDLSARASAAYQFHNAIDTILTEILDGAGLDDRLPIRFAGFLQAPAHSPLKDRGSDGDYWHVAYLFRYGVE